MSDTKMYYVASDGEAPLELFFNDIDTFVSGYKYLDLFDECGKYVKTYEFISNEYVICVKPTFLKTKES